MFNDLDSELVFCLVLIGLVVYFIFLHNKKEKFTTQNCSDKITQCVANNDTNQQICGMAGGKVNSTKSCSGTNFQCTNFSYGRSSLNGTCSPTTFTGSPSGVSTGESSSVSKAPSSIPRA